LTPRGLTSAEAAARLAAEGPNRIPGATRRGTLSIVASVLREPMLLLLVAATTLMQLSGPLWAAVGLQHVARETQGEGPA